MVARYGIDCRVAFSPRARNRVVRRELALAVRGGCEQRLGESDPERDNAGHELRPFVQTNPHCAELEQCRDADRGNESELDTSERAGCRSKQLFLPGAVGGGANDQHEFMAGNSDEQPDDAGSTDGGDSQHTAGPVL